MRKLLWLLDAQTSMRKLISLHPYTTQFLSNSNPLLLPPHPILPLLSTTTTTTSHQHKINPEQLHSYSITTGLILHPFLASRIIHLSLKHTTIPIRYTNTIFQSIPFPDVYTWNLMLAHTNDRNYYFHMRAAGLPPNTYSFALLIRCCFSVGGDAQMVHGQVAKCGVEGAVVVRNSLMGTYCDLGLVVDARKLFDEASQLDLISYNTMVSAYGKSGDVRSARELFDGMPERNLVSWSAMIDGYVRNGEWSEALALFKKMQDGVRLRLDVVILASVLKACAHLGAIYQGMWIHLLVKRNAMGGGVGNVVLATALVDMYCKCGYVDAAMGIFRDVMPHGDVVLWNAMISGLAIHSHANDALDLFWRMQDCGISPNETTFIGVLSACSHAGLIREGVELFKSMMKDHGIKPWREHYGCLTDLLGRAGLVNEAEELLLSMPMDAQASQWGALMSACKTHNSVEMGERVGKHLINLDPEDGGRYVSLSKVYMDARRHEDAREAREMMEKIGIKKETGCSSIECEGAVHEFVAGHKAHSCIADIYAMLEVLEKGLQMVELNANGGDLMIMF